METAETSPIERVAAPFDPSLPDVIVDGLERGEGFTGYPRPLELVRVIVGALVAKRWRLAPGEVRFLRGSMGLRSEDLAATLGVTASQLSRWENAATRGGKAIRISPTADRLLRVLAATHQGLPRPELRGIDAACSEPLAVRVVLGPEGWRIDSPDAADVA